jgi:acyl-homoserine-lactone acylase
MTTEVVTVTVRNPDGSLEDRSHTFYTTHFGYMIEAGFFPWGQSTAFALRFAGVEDRGGPASIAMLRSRDVRELKAAQDDFQHGTGNLIAVDKHGEALYADVGPMANFPDYKAGLFCDFGGVIDGSRSECQWDTDLDAVAPGIYGPSNQPFLFRTDYVTNSNDSHWLANPAEPLTGFNRNIGSESGERTLRTRSGLRMVRERLDGSDGLGAPRFSLDTLQTLGLSNQHEAGRLLRDDLVTLCQASPLVTLPDGTDVDLTEACTVLASWDLKADRDSRGAHLFREFLREANGGGSNRWLPSTLNYAVPFDPANPIDTPRGLDLSDNDAALQFLAAAVQKLNGVGIALDARLGDLQSVTRNGERIELHGGTESEGLFNKLEAAFQGAAGYPEVTDSSSSWIMATELKDHGAVNRGILTYGISANPNSPHFSDFTKLYSDKQWVDLPFHLHDVAATAVSQTAVKEGASDCNGGGWKEFTNPSFANANECKSYFETHRQSRIDELIERYLH